MKLENKTVFITGAAGGVGIETLRYALAANAKKIYCAARDVAALEALQANNSNIVPVLLDITDPQAVAKAAQEIDNIDILINTAGVNSGARLFDATTADFEVNVFGTLNVYKEFSKKINAGGAVVTITSILALLNLPIMGLYCASKSALHSLTQALRAELAHKNIEVYEVLAGPIETKMTQGQEMPKTKPEAIIQAIFAGIQAKTYEIYPDDFSRSIAQGLKENPSALERDFAASVL